MFQKPHLTKEQNENIAIATIGKVLLVILLIVVICPLLYLAALELEKILWMPEIQQVLDEQCGEGVFVAEPRHYSGDPMPSYYTSEVVCYKSGQEAAWVCECNGSK